MNRFVMMKDGFWKWDIGGLSFLIGSTREKKAYLALWVTTISILNYRMMERIVVEGNYGLVLKNLEKEAARLLVKSKVIGGKSFIEYIDKRQEVMDSLMCIRC
jgi:hypothetical protein